MQIIQYLLFSSVCLSILYIAYRLIYRNEANFRQMRVFLMGSVFLSLLLPLSNYKIEVWNNPQNTVSIQQFTTPANAVSPVPENNSLNMDWSGIAIDIYLLITAIFLIRLLLQLIILGFQLYKIKETKKK